MWLGRTEQDKWDMTQPGHKTKGKVNMTQNLTNFLLYNSKRNEDFNQKFKSNSEIKRQNWNDELID